MKNIKSYTSYNFLSNKLYSLPMLKVYLVCPNTLKSLLQAFEVYSVPLKKHSSSSFFLIAFPPLMNLSSSFLYSQQDK